MTESIGFEDTPDKVLPVYEDVDTTKKKIVEKLEKKQEQVRIEAEMGMEAPPKSADSVPKELPAMVFRVGAKALKCDNFLLDEEEAKTLAKHLSNLIGAQNSKMYSVFIIIVIVLGKFYNCMDALKRTFSRDKGLQEKDDKGNLVPV